MKMVKCGKQAKVEITTSINIPPKAYIHQYICKALTINYKYK